MKHGHHMRLNVCECVCLYVNKSDPVYSVFPLRVMTFILSVGKNEHLAEKHFSVNCLKTPADLYKRHWLIDIKLISVILALWPLFFPSHTKHNINI